MKNRVATAACGLAVLIAAPSSAQQPSLDRVEELARLGRPEEARSVLLVWWNESQESASRGDLQRGLWLRGRLTVDPVQAELDYQRLVVLYPRGPFTAQALLRLAQSAHAMGDADGARRYVATLARDYGDTAVRRQADAWLRAAGPAPPPPDAPPAASERPADAVARPPAAQGPRSTTPPATPSEPAPAAGNYYVQLGAFAEEDRALSLYEEVRAAGFEVRIVRVEGSRFLHVRFGRFVERADAADALERLGEAGVSAALVRDERAEVLVRQ